MKYTILCVDACETTQVNLQNLLNNQDYTLKFANSRTTALSSAAKLKPAAILLEATTQDDSGFKTCRKLKANESTCDIPVILLTHLDNLKHGGSGLDVGADEYIIQPFDADELYARIRIVLRNDQQHRSMYRLGQIDTNTGLWNRTHFDTRLFEEFGNYCRFKRSFCLLLIKPDNSDVWADKPTVRTTIQNSLARLIWQECRVYDIPCHLEMSLFAVILPQTTIKQGRLVAQRLMKAITNDDLLTTTPATKFTVSMYLTNSNKIKCEINSHLIQHFLTLSIDSFAKQQKKHRNYLSIASNVDLQITTPTGDICEDKFNILDAALINQNKNNNGVPHDIAVHKFLQAVMNDIEELLGTSHGFVYLVNSCDDTAHCVAANGLFAKLSGHTEALSERLGNIGGITSMRVFDDNNKCQHWLPGAMTFDVGVMAVAPMITQQRLIGVMGVGFESGSGKTFNDFHNIVFNRFINLLTIALYHIQFTSSVRKDVCERVQLEHELIELKQHVARENSIKARFLANMSHELRTPLNAIIGYSEILLEDAQIEECTTMTPDLTKVRDSAVFLLTLINNILDYSKLETGSSALHLERFPISDLLTTVTTIIGPIMEENGNTFKIENSMRDELFYSDQSKIRQILVNLLNNAAKFTTHGSIQLSINTIVETHDAQTIEWLEFNISDTGIGLDRTELHKIFQPFTQVDNSPTRKFGGTGLGLPLTRSFCEMMGGSIHVTSEIGKGSTFIVRLPVLAKTKEAGLLGKIQHQKTRAQHRILVIGLFDVELEKIFDHQKIQIDRANSLAHAIEEAYFSKPDVILLDTATQGGYDIELYRVLKTDEETSSIPLILVTEQSHVTNLLRDVDAGGLDYITRPLNYDEIKFRINIALRHKNTLDDLEDHTQIDRLTGLWSLEHYQLRLEQEIASARRYHRTFTLLYLQIDHWHEILNLHGFTAGKHMLQIIGDILAGICRTSDIPCRYNIDSFIIILIETPIDNAVVFSERLRKVIANRFDRDLATYKDNTLSMAIVSADTIKSEDAKPVQILTNKIKYAINMAQHAGMGKSYVISDQRNCILDDCGKIPDQTR